jgi:hypothetical protein
LDAFKNDKKFIFKETLRSSFMVLIGVETRWIKRLKPSKPEKGERTMKVAMSVFTVVATITLLAVAGFAAETAQSEAPTKHGPPPGAYTACTGKTAGAAAQFIDPRGETVSGTCEQEGNRMVLRPDRSKGKSSDRQGGPPPEAYKACLGKTAGAFASFVDPRGETLTGSCEQEGDRLVLRPDRNKRAAQPK